jgi:plasmid stabilization system protein ParE
MTRSLRFDGAAERELNEAVDFYDAESRALGDAFLAEVRRRLLHTFPYSLFYSLHAQEVRILAVAHQRRRPFYWEDRR